MLTEHGKKSKSGRNGGLLLLTTITTLLLVTSTIVGAPPAPHLRVNNPLPYANSTEFGRNISVTSEGKLLTGARGRSSERAEGALFVIDIDTGKIELTIHPEPEIRAGFGEHSWSGNTRIIASASLESDLPSRTWRIYVFDKFTGEHTLTITNPNPEEDDEFGYSLGMLGDTAIISARPENRLTGSSTGIVYLFDTLTGNLLKTIQNPDPTARDNFGHSVAGVGNDKILVGAPKNDTGATDAGAAYLLDASTGDVIHTIYNPASEKDAKFGSTVRSDGEGNLLIGSPNNDKAFLHDGETGRMIHQFDKPITRPGWSLFGYAVGSVDQFILIGNHVHVDGNTKGAGRAFLYHRETGALLYTLENPNPASLSWFGASVVGANGKIAVSAPAAHPSVGASSGSIYIYNGPTTSACCDWTLYH